jgi:hypothetical protein
VTLRAGALVATFACVLAAAAGADAAKPRRALFDVTLKGSQVTTVDATARCSANGGHMVERVDFSTSRAGKALFKSDRRGVVTMSSLRTVLANGTLNRRSSLDELGTSPGDCDNVAPAQGCGVHTFGDWRLTLYGGLALGVAAGKVTGGNPFRQCQNPFDGYPHLVRKRAAIVKKKPLFNTKKRTLTVPGGLDETRAFTDGYSGSSGTAATQLRFTATLKRR